MIVTSRVWWSDLETLNPRPWLHDQRERRAIVKRAIHHLVWSQRQDAGRACVVEKGPSANSVFRASNYPIGGVDPRNPNRIMVTYGSYINRNSNEANGCTPAGINLATGTVNRHPVWGGLNFAGGAVLVLAGLLALAASGKYQAWRAATMTGT